MNVPSAQLASVLPNAPGAAFKFGASLAAKSELSLFLSLMTGLLDKSPDVAAAVTQQAAFSSPSGSNQVQVAGKGKRSDFASDISKDTKNNKREEPVVALQLVMPPVQETTPFFVPAVAANVPSAEPEPVDRLKSSGNGNDAAPMLHPDPALEPSGSGVRVAATQGDRAFTLRLTAKSPLGENISQPVAAPAQPETSASSIPRPAPGPANPNRSPGADMSSSTFVPRTVVAQMPTPLDQISNGPIVNEPQIHDQFDFKPTQIITTEKSSPQAELMKKSAPAEQATSPVTTTSAVAPLGSSVVAAPNVTEAPFTRAQPASSKQNPESVAPPTPEGHSIPDQQSRSEQVAAASTKQADGSAPPPDRAWKNCVLPIAPRNTPQTSPARESGISQPVARESKTEATAKPDLRALHLNNPHIEANTAALDGSARPVETANTLEVRPRQNAGPGSDALKVMSEPEIKAAVAPPPTRQISLRLSSDDSTKVNVDLTERAGKVQVSVRTLDHELAKSLRTDLGDLVGRLESKGFKTETWIPAAAHGVVGEPQQTSNSSTSHGQPEHSGSWPGSDGQRQRQNGSNQRQQQRWTEQLEETVSATKARNESQ